MNIPYCCPACFGDPGLSANIFPLLHERMVPTPGETECPRCHHDSALLVDPTGLAEYFEPVLDAYEKSSADDAMTLPQLLRRDWLLFESLKEDASVHALLTDIFDDGNRYRGSFSKIPQAGSVDSISWDGLRRQLMHVNRWFLDPALDLSKWRDILASLEINSDTVASSWYRSRRHAFGQVNKYRKNEMGAPPAEVATHGRANPAGIPVLYLASNPDTAVAEIRPHVGESVSVATFETHNLRVVDLRNPRQTVSPFLLGDPDAVLQMLSDVGLMETLGHQLTRPVSSDRAAYEYAPSQFLCELIKSTGFDGVVYKSGLAAGSNLVIFNPDAYRAKKVEHYTVSSVVIVSTKIGR